MAIEPTIKIEKAPVLSQVENEAYQNKEYEPQNLGERPIELVEETKNLISSASVDPVAKTIPDNTQDDYYYKREAAIDNILSEGLAATFLEMPIIKQKIFKEEGEKTVKKINVLMSAAKINIGKIASLIRKWLSIIPGINTFFLDQEAKIKTDRIINIKNKL